MVGLLAVHAGLVTHCAVEDFVTFDEVGNLAAGVAYLHNGDYDLYNVNPPLTKQFAAALVCLAAPETTGFPLASVRGQRVEWAVGERFAWANADRYHTLVVLARLPGVAWSVLGGLIVYRWASRLWGPAGGLVSLSCWCFEPNVIAHAHLVTADLPAAVAALAAAYCYQRYLANPGWRSAAAAGAVLGLAQLCKFTLIALYPVWVMVGLITIWVRARTKGRGPGLGASFGQLGVLLGASVVVINLGYEFAGTGTTLGDYQFFSRLLASPPTASRSDLPHQVGNRFRDSWAAALPIPLPGPLLRGIDVQRTDMELAQERTHYYLLGEWKVGGWWYYYPYAAAVKLPIGLIILLVAGAGLSLLSPASRPGWKDLLLLWGPAAAILALAMSQMSIQRHFRYVLPALPFGVVLLGAAGAGWSTRSGWWKLVLVAMAAWAAGSYLWVHPHALAYFNEAAGGPSGGHRHLLGSNLDWGQDLWRLKWWLEEHPEARGLRLGYCNHMDPRIAGLQFEPPPPRPDPLLPPAPAEMANVGPQPGYYAVSVQLVMGGRGLMADGRGGYVRPPLGAYDYFQRFQPISRAGYSILIYRISPEQANAVRKDLGLPAAAAPEEGAAPRPR